MVADASTSAVTVTTASRRSDTARSTVWKGLGPRLGERVYGLSRQQVPTAEMSKPLADEPALVDARFTRGLDDLLNVVDHQGLPIWLRPDNQDDVAYEEDRYEEPEDMEPSAHQ